jgi:hypothetical protein
MLLDSMHNALRALSGRGPLSRREVLGLAGTMGAGLATAGLWPDTARGANAPRTLDLRTPADNVYAWCKTWGTLGDEPVFGGHEGVFFAVVGDQRAMPLFGYVGFGSLQFSLLASGDALYRGKDATFYTDLRTGELLDTWQNPFTGKRVRVHPYINDRVRTTMPQAYPVERFATDAYRWQTSIGNAASRTESAHGYRGDAGVSGKTAPFVLPWRRVGSHYLLSWDWMLEIANPVNPDGWPLASTGRVINPSEHFVFFVPAAELEDRGRPWATMTAGFFRSTPWLPWMHMGGSGVAGRLFASSHSYKITGARDNIPRPVREYLEKHRPDMLLPPTDWEPGPISSTWGEYARTVPPENAEYQRER